MQYKTCSARILDAKRKFTEAAVRYYELSQLISRHMGDSIAADELDTALSAAVTCVILAPPGPQRSRVLAQLYKDERCMRLPLYLFLEKVYLERILGTAEVRWISGVCFLVCVYDGGVCAMVCVCACLVNIQHDVGCSY